VETTLAEFLADTRHRTAQGGQEDHTDTPVWYGANNWVVPWLVPHLSTPPWYPAHVFRATDTRLWIGPPGSGVQRHRDIQDNFSQQLFGSKHWTLVPPHYAAQLGTTEVTPFLHTTAVGEALQRGEPWPQAIPRLRFELGPDEMLFVPAGWFHATEARGTEISGSVNFFASACFGSLGVLVPKLPHLCEDAWVCGLEPGTWQDAQLKAEPGQWTHWSR